MSIPYPGNVNQPDRKDPDWEQYHTFEQQVNHELPDMRNEWQDDSRDEIGFGIPEANPPTVASVRVAANKAVRIAVLLLGEKVDDDVIEAQARDFMGLSQEVMDRTLDRFAKSQSLYAEDEKDEEEKKASEELAEKGSEVPAPIKAPEKTKVKAEEKKEEEKKEAADEKKDDEKKEAADEKEEEKEAADEKEEEKEAAEEDDEKKEASVGSPNELNIELTGAADEEMKDDPEADKQLASLFDDDGLTAKQEEQPKAAASKKAGIRKLGGQPKVAAAEAAPVDISSIWETAPDVSELFK